MTPGTSGALEIALETLCERGRTVLLPKPGFTLFKCLASNLELKQNFYTLLVNIKHVLEFQCHWSPYVIIYIYIRWPSTAREELGGWLGGSGEADWWQHSCHCCQQPQQPLWLCLLSPTPARHLGSGWEKESTHHSRWRLCWNGRQTWLQQVTWLPIVSYLILGVQRSWVLFTWVPIREGPNSKL